jgi:hypothetical protein
MVKLPDDWGDTLLVDPEPTIKFDGIPTLREHCVALSYAMIGVGDTAATRILQVFKPVFAALRTKHYPGNIYSLKSRLGADEWCDRKVHLYDCLLWPTHLTSSLLQCATLHFCPSCDSEQIMQIHERSGGDDRSVACEDCGEAAYLRIRRLGGKAKWVPLNTDIVTCPYDHFLSMIERPLTMPMYQRSLAKMKTVYDSLDMIGPMPIHDWYNGTLRKWLRLHGDTIEWETTGIRCTFS